MKNVTFIRNEFHLLYVLKSKNFAIRLKKKTNSKIHSKHRIFDRNIRYKYIYISLYWFLANAINRREKRAWVPTSGEASFSKLLSLLRLASSPLEKRCFFFFNPENVPRRGKEWSGGRRRSERPERESVGGKKTRNEETLALVWRTNGEHWDR